MGDGYPEIKDIINTNNVQISFHLGANRKLTIIRSNRQSFERGRWPSSAKYESNVGI